MLANLLFGQSAGLEIVSVEAAGSQFQIHVKTSDAYARCIACNSPSKRVHSRYTRTLRDLAIAGQPTVLRVQVRRFRCEDAQCTQRIFSESIDHPQRLLEEERLTAAIAKHEQMFTDISDEGMPSHLPNVETLSVEDMVKSATDDLNSKRGQVAASKRRYAEFSALRDESVSLAQRLRDVATQILGKSAEPNTCPLCHTTFPPGELSKHIHVGVDPQLEEPGIIEVT